jgi:hypothetical protein
MSVTLHFKDNSTPVVLSTAVTATPYKFTNTDEVDNEFIAVSSPEGVIALVPVVNLEYADIA